MPSPIDYEQIAQAQQNDPELQSLLSNSNIFHFKKINLPDCKKAIFCDLSTGTARPYIPKQFREHVFATLHNVSHSGARSTSKLVRTRFVWPSIGKDCTNWAKCCIPCQKSKIARHNKTPLGKFVDQTERQVHEVAGGSSDTRHSGRDSGEAVLRHLDFTFRVPGTFNDRSRAPVRECSFPCPLATPGNQEAEDEPVPPTVERTHRGIPPTHEGDAEGLRHERMGSCPSHSATRVPDRLQGGSTCHLIRAGIRADDPFAGSILRPHTYRGHSPAARGGAQVPLR
ncbi:hypothetical protein JTE90_009521 [Oedothorax gibbosus]|uniref:Integrase zinc-binding domain-containing protein n=1 Tax=Oedothorax gibbosus TaxID=931172 RepID=A0AAV6UUG6_9ARAC|nr:hypothetical protein JTE90_009521 [Oedothorax gibbosus]